MSELLSDRHGDKSISEWPVGGAPVTFKWHLEYIFETTLKMFLRVPCLKISQSELAHLGINPLQSGSKVAMGRPRPLLSFNHISRTCSKPVLNCPLGHSLPIFRLLSCHSWGLTLFWVSRIIRPLKPPVEDDLSYDKWRSNPRFSGRSGNTRVVYMYSDSYFQLI